MKILRLVRFDFDNLENSSSDAVRVNVVATFCDDEKKTAHKKVGDWLHNTPPQHLYLGWDGEVYPQYKVETEYAK